MNFVSILAGLAAIPRLIDKIESLIEHAKSEESKKWMQVSARIERKLSEASSPEELRNVAKELKDLIDKS